PVTSGGLAELWNLGERVEGLTLGGRTLTQADLQGLGQLTHVTELSLSGGKFQAVEGAPTLLEALGGLRRLRVLRLQGLPVGDAIAGVVVQMPGLEELDLSRCEVSGAVLGELSQIKTLKVLSLTGAKGLGLALRQGVPPNRTLKSLDLSGTGLAGSDFMGLSRFRTLDHLVLDGCQLDDERLLALVRILKLTSISLNGTQVTEAGIKRLEKTSLRQVRWRGKWSEVREVGKGKP
ncbi:MAG: hypothetical protein KDK99_22060, partial [Verrucomicrobiales bacterium]|nr:hypothetical protein [Verrucomicrobiales bacterium]